MRIFSLVLVFSSFIFFSNLSFAMTQYGPIKAGDTLWGIAKKHRPAKISVEKMVLAIQTANPSATREGILSKGGYLSLPISKEEVEKIFKNPSNIPGSLGAKAPVKSAESPSNPTHVEAVQPAQISEPVSQATHPSGALPIDARASAKVAPPVRSKAALALAAEQNQTIIDDLKKNFDLEHAARLKAEEKVDQFSILIKDQSEQVSTLEKTVTNLENGFSWSWLWFLGLVGLGVYTFYRRQYAAEFRSPASNIAAARLGITRTDPPGSRVQSYPTKRFDESYQPMDKKKTEGHGAVMADAMIDMAEGNDVAAEVKLKAQIAKEPDNIELRMKLLEVYIEQNNREKFKTLADELLAKFISEDDPEWARIQAIYLSKWVYD